MSGSEVKFTPDGADSSWYPRVLRVLARDYPEISDKVWETAIDENAVEQVARQGKAAKPPTWKVTF